jgi:RimJ/RimL family protein N-acetyltransferase
MINLQPTHLSNEWISLIPLAVTDFEKLFLVASDPLIWEQHPNKNRYQRAVFQNFFEGAITSGGAFYFTDTKTGEMIGSSRFCNYNETTQSIEIGYTFLARSCWGKPYNFFAKELMLDYIFQYVNTVVFHIGSLNIRSQKAIGKMGAVKVGEEEHAYFGETNNLNFVYEIKKNHWLLKKN